MAATRGARAALLALAAAGFGVNPGPLQAVATEPTAPVLPADAQPPASRTDQPLCRRKLDPDRSKALATP